MNNNWNINAELAKNVKFKVVKGKVYVKTGNNFVLRNAAPSAPIRKYKLSNLNIAGPGTRLYNTPRLENAIKVYTNAVQKQLNAAAILKVVNPPAYVKALRHILAQGYVTDKLRSVGHRNGSVLIKNYTAHAKNNKSLRGFAVIHNSRVNANNRILNVLVARPGEGVGRILMNRILGNASRNGKTLRLNSVRSAVNFYRKFGFEPIGNVVNGGTTPMRRRAI